MDAVSADGAPPPQTKFTAPWLSKLTLTSFTPTEPSPQSFNFNDPLDVEEFDELTAAWVNIKAFQGRCTGAGLDAEYKYRFTTAGFIIDIGLQPGFPAHHKTKLDCYIMAAAQYLLHAGDVIHDECVRQRRSPAYPYGWKGFDNGNGPVVWKRWGQRLSEIAVALESGGELGFKLEEKNRAALTDMVIRARDKVVGLEPEMFAQQEPASAVSSGEQEVEVEAGTEVDG